MARQLLAPLAAGRRAHRRGRDPARLCPQDHRPGEDARRQIAGRKLVGRIRLGIVEDLAVTRLPSIIADFRRRHPLGRDRADVGEQRRFERGPPAMADAMSSWPIPPASPGRRSAHLSRAAGLVRQPHHRASTTMPNCRLIMFDGSCSWQDRMLASLAEAGISLARRRPRLDLCGPDRGIARRPRHRSPAPGRPALRLPEPAGQLQPAARRRGRFRHLHYQKSAAFHRRARRISSRRFRDPRRSTLGAGAISAS